MVLEPEAVTCSVSGAESSKSRIWYLKHVAVLFPVLFLQGSGESKFSIPLTALTGEKGGGGDSATTAPS